MAVPNVPRKIVLPGNGTGPYAFNFKVQSSDQLLVQKRVGAVITTLALTTDYTVALTNGGVNGGVVTLVSGLTGADSLLVEGNTVISQTIPYANLGPFNAYRHEVSFDKVTFILQELAAKMAGTIKIPAIDETGTSVILPPAAVRAGKAIVFDVDGNIGVSLSDFDTIVSDAQAAASAAIAARDIAVAASAAAVDARDDILNDPGFQAVAADLTGPDNIGKVANNISDVNDVAANIPAIVGVNNNEANINIVAANVTPVGTVATDIAAVQSAATNMAAIIAAPTEAANAAASAATALAAQAAAQTAASAVANLWNFDTSTAMADPGATDIRFNNAVLASVTAIAISATTADTGNPDLSDYIITWDDSSHTPRGILSLRTGDGDICIFAITGNITDNGAWLQIPVSYTAGTATLSAGEDCYVSFSGFGNDGTGTGNVNNSGTPTADQVAIWTNSTTVKGVTISGDGTLTGLGVLSITAARMTNTGLKILDTDASHVLTIAPGSNLTADRTLTITTGDSNRTLTLSGNATISGTNTGDTLTSQTLGAGVGFVATSTSLGTISSGTVTPLATTNGNFNHYTNNGAHTLAPPASPCTMVIEVTNGASAGAITTSSYTKVDVSAYNTTNGNKFHFCITKGNAYSSLIVQALQ